MKSKIVNNIGWKLLSLFCAFILWLVVVNISDPTISRKFVDIPVNILNENALSKTGKVYEVVSGDKVSVIVKGKRSVIEKLEEKQFKATADLAQLSAVNAVPINVTLNSSRRSDVELDWGSAVLKVSLEDKKSQEFRVEVKKTGNLSSNLVLGEVSVTPNIITITGGKSKIDRVASVGVTVDMDDQDKKIDERLKPILYDKDGQEVDARNITFSSETVNVTADVLPTKNVPVHVKTVGKPAEGYRLADTNFKPEEIKIYGKQAELDKITSIELKVNIDGAKKDVEREMDITNQLSENVDLVGDITKVTVRCVIEKNGKRTFVLSNSDINVENVPEGMAFNFLSMSMQYSVEVTAEEEDLKNFTVNSLNAYIDLSKLKEGSHSLDIKFSLPGKYVVKCTDQVNIRIEKKDSNNGDENPDEEDNSNE